MGFHSVIRDTLTVKSDGSHWTHWGKTTYTAGRWLQASNGVFSSEQLLSFVSELRYRYRSFWISTNQIHSDAQSQKAVSAYFTCKQILPFWFAAPYNITSLRVTDTAWLTSSQHNIQVIPAVCEHWAVSLVYVWTAKDPKVKRPHDSAETRIPRPNVHMTQLWPGSQGKTSTWLSCDQDHWGTEAWIQTHLLGYIAMLGLYILEDVQSEHCYVP